MDHQQTHRLYETGHPLAPDAILDRNGEVVLGCCMRCGAGEIELEQENCEERQQRLGIKFEVATLNEGDPVGRIGNDWGFWDEVWSNWHGGADDEAGARAALELYVKTELDPEHRSQLGVPVDAFEAMADDLDFHPARDPYKVRLIWATPNGDQMIGYMARVSNSSAKPEDEASKLIGYLLRNHHWSPFEMAGMCVEIRTQRDISAQILRHWSSRFQEFSTRYAEVEDLLAHTECRFQDHKNRQNSWTREQILVMLDGADDGINLEEGKLLFPAAIRDEIVSNEALLKHMEDTESYWDALVNESRVRALEGYQEALRRGVAKEVARRILPFGLIPTKLYMVNNMRGWLTYTAERTKAGVQKEHRVIAVDVLLQMASCFPAVVEAALNAGLYAGATDETVSWAYSATRAGFDGQRAAS